MKVIKQPVQKGYDTIIEYIVLDDNGKFFAKYDNETDANDCIEKEEAQKVKKRPKQSRPKPKS